MRGSRLTRKQKVLLAEMEYLPENYLMLRDLPNTLTVKDKETGETVNCRKKSGKREKR